MSRSNHIRVVALLAALVLAISPIATPFAAAAISPTAIPDFTITGGGYGHGIGMSQYGAQGYALNGWKYDAILKHYYTGITIAKQANTVSPRVNLDKSGSAQLNWTIRAVDATLTVYDSSATPITKSFPKNAYYTFTHTTAGTVVKNSSGTTVATLQGTVTADPYGSARVEIKDESGPVLNSSYPNGYPYMRYRGKLQLVQDAGDKLYVYNLVSFQEYLYGVIPRESPASWNAEALKAQSVAARSYAKVKIDPNDDGERTANLACTTADQVYGGYSRLSGGTEVKHEVSTTNAAVDATLDLVAKSGSTIAQTFFFSSSGGNTANIEDSWGYSSPKDYLKGVADPYEDAAGSPYSSWTVKLGGLDLAAKLRASSKVRNELADHGLPAIPGSSVYWVTGVTITRGVSGYPRWTYFHFSDPAKTVCKLSADTVRVALGLRSPNFSFSGFPMSRIQGPDRYATSATLSQRTFATTAPAVVIASGEDYPDALTGSALAGAENGALLLTKNDSLPAVTATELTRLRPARVYIMGSTSVISAAVETQISDVAKAAVPSAVVTRIDGTDRYETARKAADRIFTIAGPTKAIVVNGNAWPDAAAVSALAYSKAYPILLAKPTALGTAASGYLSAHTPEMYVIGSSTVVPDSVFAEVKAAVGSRAVVRLYGANRYATAAAVARQTMTYEGFLATEVYITTGLNYPDALSGGMLAGSLQHPLLLTHPDGCPSGLAAFLDDKKSVINYIWILGSSAAISPTGLDAIDSVMMH